MMAFPANIADAGILSALGSARSYASIQRFLGLRDKEGIVFQQGYAIGQIRALQIWMDGDQDLAQGAMNEVRFLLGTYLR